MADSSEPKNNKRKRGNDTRLQHGSRNKRNKGGDLGRKDWSRQQHDRRAQNEAATEKRDRIIAEEGMSSVLPAPFSQDEIAAEERRPKHKVAVMIGYSGTGYRGMQINYTEKTIEGDLFTAFVAAGAISKANANDPKKSALVRCARTDKGVHAAGNVISLKLIVEDPDIVAKINASLSPQIRVWGFQRTTNSFSCYQACDSRWYEYLIPTHCFVPPHPNSHLGRKLVQLAAETGDLEGYHERQKEVADFWSMVEEAYIKPILKDVDESVRDDVCKALYDSENIAELDIDGDISAAEETRIEQNTSSSRRSLEDVIVSEALPSLTQEDQTTTKHNENNFQARPTNLILDRSTSDNVDNTNEPVLPSDTARESEAMTNDVDSEDSPELKRKKVLDAAIKILRQAYLGAKRTYRIPPERQERVKAALQPFLGTQNFHNYTVNKSFRDPSAKRIIKSFHVEPKPLIINGTEWLSLKIHGQSFMMHQIRKMISMIALTVRCGCPVSRIRDTFAADTVSIPKVPGLGLLLERPVFDSYNEGPATKFDREKIDFGKYEAEMLAFKQREIYERIFREEEQGNAFHTFFNHVDGYKDPQFLFLSSKGIAAVKVPTSTNAGQRTSKKFPTTVDSEDDDGDLEDRREEG